MRTAERHIEAGQERNNLSWWNSLAIKYSGYIDVAALNDAFQILLSRNPIMRAKIISDGSSRLLRVSSDSPFGELVVREGGTPSYLRELVLPRDAAQPLCQLVLIHNGSKGYIMLITKNVIGDGENKLRWLRDLWTSYIDAVAGIDIPRATEVWLPDPPSKLIARYLNEVQDEQRSDPVVRVAKSTSMARLSDGVARHLTLSAAETSAMVHMAKTLDVTVHSLFSAAFLIALRNLDDATKGPTRTICRSSVNLRHRLTPPAKANEVTFGEISHQSEIHLPYNGNLANVARGVKSQLHGAIERGELIPRTAQVDNMTACAEHDRALAVSSVGEVPLFPQAPSVEIVGIDTADVGSKLVCPMYPCVANYTYAGQLFVKAVFPLELFSESDIDAVMGTSVQLLCNAQ